MPAGMDLSWLKESFRSTNFVRCMMDSGRLVKLFLDRSKRVRL